MKIDAGVGYLYTSRRMYVSQTTARAENQASIASVLASKTSQSDSATSSVATTAKHADFTTMTRQEMRNWVNDKIRTGEMSIDESTPFVGMTLAVSVQDFQIVDSATDVTRIDFLGKARLGIEGALSRNDVKEAAQLQAAVNTMLHFQGQAMGVDTHA